MPILVNFPGTSAQSGGYIPNVSPTQDGLMSYSDKDKLDKIAASANNYTHPTTHSADMITESATKLVMTADERVKLSNIAANANNYTHPSTHSADIITESATKKILTADERVKLNGVEVGATKYIHPAAHSADMITETATKTFITPEEKIKLSEIDISKYILKTEVKTMIRNASGIYVPSDNVRIQSTILPTPSFDIGKMYKILEFNFMKSGRVRIKLSGSLPDTFIDWKIVSDIYTKSTNYANTTIAIGDSVTYNIANFGSINMVEGVYKNTIDLLIEEPIKATFYINPKNTTWGAADPTLQICYDEITES